VGEQRVFFNRGGTLIWELIDGQRDVNRIVESLLQQDQGFQDPLKQVAEKTSNFVNTLFRLKLLDRLHEDGTIETAPSSSSAGDSGDRPLAAATLQPIQDVCMTVPKRNGFSAWVSQGPEVPQTVEETFQELYWQHRYIQKMHVELTYRCNFRCIQCYNTTHAG